MRLARKSILKIRPYIPGKPIDEVKRELGLRKVTKLASNENALGPSLKVRQAVSKAAAELNRYPDGDCFYLKKALAKKHNLRPENIIVGNGSDEIIILALRAFLHKGEEAIISRPTFLIYDIASMVADARIKYVPLRDYRYDMKAIADRLTKKTKIVFIANPDNPTGTYVTAREMDDFLKKVGRNTIVFIDEAYYEFAAARRDYPRTLKYPGRKNVIITRTFSKAYSLAGLRVGYGIADSKIIGCLNRVREPFNVNSLAQAAALEALKDDGHVRKTLSMVEKGKAYLYGRMESLGLECIPSAANFILVNLKRDSKKIYAELLKKGIIVREMSHWGMRGFIRVTIGTARENRRFVAALKEVLS